MKMNIRAISLTTFLGLALFGTIMGQDANMTRSDVLVNQVSALQAQVATMEANLRVEDGKLQNQIDAGKNSMFSLALPYAFTLAIAMVYYFFGNASQNGKIKDLTSQRVEQALSNTVPAICDQKVWEYFKKKFPGDLPHLELAAKLIAYDAELRQTKRITVLGKTKSLSEPLIDQLRQNGFLSVEFRPLENDIEMDTQGLYLIDRYSHEGGDSEVGKELLEKILRKVKKRIDQGDLIQTHIYGKNQVVRGEELVTQHNGFTQIPSKLIPNIMDQLRYAFPKNYQPA